MTAIRHKGQGRRKKTGKGTVWPHSILFMCDFGVVLSGPGAGFDDPCGSLPSHNVLWEGQGKNASWKSNLWAQRHRWGTVKSAFLCQIFLVQYIWEEHRGVSGITGWQWPLSKLTSSHHHQGHRESQGTCTGQFVPGDSSPAPSSSWEWQTFSTNQDFLCKSHGQKWI